MEEYVLRGPDSAKEIPEFNPNISVIDVLFRALERNGDNIFQIEAASGAAITYSEFLKESKTIAANLALHGITAGDIVVLCLDKNFHTYALLVGVIFTGATAALWGTFYDGDEYQRRIKNCQPKLVFCSKETFKKMAVPDDMEKVVFSFPDGTSPNLGYNLLEQFDGLDYKPYKVTDVKNHSPVIMFTSGSTGPSKPTLIPNSALQRYGFRFSGENTRRFLVVSPFCWISSTLTFMSAVIDNYTMVLSVPDPVLHLQYTQQYETDTWMITPPFMLTLLTVKNASSYDLSIVRNIITGGKTLSVQQKKMFIKTLLFKSVVLSHLYGATETGVFTTFRGIEPEIAHSTLSSGVLSSGAEIKVVDENGQTLGPGQMGELKAKTETMMAKYVGYPEETAKAFDSEGWFCTGDYGYCDEKGFVFALGRLSDMVNYKGKRVWMTPIEDLLQTHPAVFDAIIVSKPHPIDLEHPAAFVVIKPDFIVSETEIRKFIDDQVEDRCKLRGGIYFIDSIPKLPNGKVNKKVIVDKLLK